MAGDTEEELIEQKVPYIAGRASYTANARGQIIGDNDGFLKLLFRASDMKLLGVHVIGEAGDRAGPRRPDRLAAERRRRPVHQLLLQLSDPVRPLQVRHLRRPRPPGRCSAARPSRTPPEPGTRPAPRVDRIGEAHRFVMPIRHVRLDLDVRIAPAGGTSRLALHASRRPSGPEDRISSAIGRVPFSGCAVMGVIVRSPAAGPGPRCVLPCCRSPGRSDRRGPPSRRPSGSGPAPAPRPPATGPSRAPGPQGSEYSFSEAYDPIPGPIRSSSTTDPSVIEKNYRGLADTRDAPEPFEDDACLRCHVHQGFDSKAHWSRIRRVRRRRRGRVARGATAPPGSGSSPTPSAAGGA